MAKDLNHIPLSRKSSKIHNETTVVIKIEGNERGVSHPSRNDKWYEDFEITIDKANEVELTVYDQQTGGDPTPIGMVWFRISDIAEALRRQKVAAADNATTGQAGTWVTAAKAASMRIPPNAPGSNSDSTLHGPRGASGNDARGGEGIDGWFAVEPAGALSLHLKFGTSNGFQAGDPIYSQLVDPTSQGKRSQETFGSWSRRFGSTRRSAQTARRRPRDERT
jgi:hypothetical protein